MKNTELPAYPTDDHSHGVKYGQIGGLTKREYFAAKAMHGLVSAQGDEESVRSNIDWFTDLAIQIADSLLNKLEK